MECGQGQARGAATTLTASATPRHATPTKYQYSKLNNYRNITCVDVPYITFTIMRALVLMIIRSSSLIQFARAVRAS